MTTEPKHAFYEANTGAEFSKSANAAQAEADGRYPMTVAAKKLGLTVRAFRAGCHAVPKSIPDEWHHTGRYARRTPYYDTVVLSTLPDFWRAAAREYQAKKAARILAAHNVSPASDAEIADAKAAAIRVAVENVTRFLERYGAQFVVQLWRQGAGCWTHRLHANTALGDLGLLSGYDFNTYGLPIHATLESAQAEVARREIKWPDTKCRIVTVREDVLADCPLYGRVAGEFLNLGQARDFFPHPDAR